MGKKKLVSSQKSEEKEKENLLLAQTTRPESFEPVLIVWGPVQTLGSVFPFFTLRYCYTGRCSVVLSIISSALAVGNGTSCRQSRLCWWWCVTHSTPWFLLSTNPTPYHNPSNPYHGYGFDEHQENDKSLFGLFGLFGAFSLIEKRKDRKVEKLIRAHGLFFELFKPAGQTT